MQPESTPASERLTTYQLRARANGALGKTKEQEADLSEAIALLDQVDAISATNPYAYEERAKARMKLGEFPGAADDLQVAEVLFKDTGDKIRRALAAADGALAAYGAGDVERGVELMRGTFKVKRTLATNNPDDIVLLQELSRRDAELHIAYAAHLFTEQGALLAAARQWESGCVRLETYVVDGQLRFDEERRLQAKEAASAEATGTEQVLRSESVRSPFEAADDFRARLNGLDPRSPFVTQRPGTQYFWYKTGEGEVERRDPGNQLRDRERDVAIGLSCTAFRDPAWVARYRPEWPPNLAARMKTYAQEVELPAVPLPPKGAPPTRGELEF